jgi:elongation factor 3
MSKQSFDDFLKQQQQAPRGGAAAARGKFSASAAPFSPGSGFNTPSYPTSGAATPSAGLSTTSLASLNTALSKLNVEETPIQEHLVAIQHAAKISEVKHEVAAIADAVTRHWTAEHNPITLWRIADILKLFAKPKNSPLVREALLLLVQQLALAVNGRLPREAHLLALVPAVFDAFTDKDKNVVKAAQQALEALYGAFPAEALGTTFLDQLLAYLALLAKWNLKMACLTTLDHLIDEVLADLLELKFVKVVPTLTDLATDFKPELARLGIKTLRKFVLVLDNLDLQNKYDIIVETLADPKRVPECVRVLSLVTFVAEVTEPALLLLVPILDKLLKMLSLSMDQLRQTVTVTENLTRLVNNKREIEAFIPVLLPGVAKVVENALLPEVRELASKALRVLEDADAEHADGKFHGRLHLSQARFYVLDSGVECPIEGVDCGDEVVDNYVYELVTADANVNDWKRLKAWLETHGNAEYAAAVVHNLRQLFDQDTARVYDDDEEGAVEVVNTDFSLAYGLRMLLNKTTLRLLKGHRYGLCGRNGAGKSTLMRAISKGQLEGFPTPDQLKTCFVEHKIQGEEGDMDLVSFIASDPELQHVESALIRQALLDVGFPHERTEQNVGLLLGGWKMKLELARAMLMKADVLLLDEPTNHLDVANVKWLEDYLIDNTHITSLIVLHDLGFLDAVCTDIIHYENKKLAYYRGNLLAFVEVKPEGKLYYTLTDSNVKMAFPPPGILTGVKLNTRAVARLLDVTFTYPGGTKPSLAHVLCLLLLLLRVAILGPNGAGKSTLIKLLTGELTPQEGKVEKHPNLRIGYIAQHALQHVEQHKEKTANQYLQWRYRFGDDREVLLKELRKISEDEKEQMAKEIDVDDGRGKRVIEAIVGRQKLKKSFQYEVKWKNWLPKYNSWVSKEVLAEHGFHKLMQRFDDHESLREGLGYRDLTPKVIRKHFEDVGLDGDIADHTPMGSLSGGQLVKVVIAGAMWNNPHLLVLDEPTNYLDRDSLGGLAVAIRDWTGGVVMISHNNEFVGALCPEQWHVENGEVVQTGTVSVDSNRFEDSKDGESASPLPLPAPKKRADDDDSPANIKVRQRKKKMTRNDKKLQAERRRLRYIEWLNTPKGTPRPADTDDEEE